MRALTGFDFRVRHGTRQLRSAAARAARGRGHAGGVGRPAPVRVPPGVERFAQPEGTPALDRVRGIVLAAAREEGMPILDGVDVLTAGGDPLDSFPYRLHGHYSEQGYRLVGEAILARILAEEGAPAADPQAEALVLVRPRPSSFVFRLRPSRSSVLHALALTWTRFIQTMAGLGCLLGRRAGFTRVGPGRLLGRRGRRARLTGTAIGRAERDDVVHPQVRLRYVDPLDEQLNDRPAVLPGAALEPAEQTLLELSKLVDDMSLCERALMLLVGLRDACVTKKG